MDTGNNTTLNSHSVDSGEISEYLRNTLKQEKWFIDPPHHVKKRNKNPIAIGVISQHTYQFSTVALGYLSIYHSINRDPNCPGIADRVCVYDPISSKDGLIHPGIQLDQPLVTLERQIPLKDLDLICLSLTNSDAVTTVLGLLELGGVPLRAKERREQGGPIILAGGPGCCNPEPFAEFFDLFCVGEGRMITASVVQAIYTLGSSHSSAQNIFREVGPVPGFYVPSLYRFSFVGSKVSGVEPLGAPLKVKAACDLPEIWAQSSMFTAGNTVVIVPSTGCKNRCAYCQLSEISYQEYEVNPLLKQVERYLAAEVNTLIINSATLTQYSQLEQLFVGIRDRISASGRKINVYIGSLRFDEISDADLARMSELGVFSHTYMLYTGGEAQKFMALAPEHGSRNLMRRLQRKVDPWCILETVELAKQHGVHNFVLYFVVGFESETAEDRGKISELITALLEKVRANQGKVILKINPLIPTPGTACQRMAMPSIEDYDQFVAEIEADLVDRIGLERFENQVEIVQLAKQRLVIEGIINRADRRIGSFIGQLTQLRMRGIEPEIEQLMEWLRDYDLDWSALSGPRSEHELLPWTVVDQTLLKVEQAVLKDLRLEIDE